MTTVSPEAIPALVGLLLCMAHENAGGSRNEWLLSVHALVLVAWGRYRQAPEYWEIMNDLVNEFRWVFESGYRRSGVLVNVESDFVRMATVGLECIWVEFGRSHSPHLRAATARLLRTLDTRIGLAASLQEMLMQLGVDARARVRAQARS